MTYDIKFRTLAASYPSLHWDVRHLDTWIDCIPMPKAQPERWPCPHCGSTYHFPERCPFRIGTSSNPPNRQLPTIGGITNAPNFSHSATFSTPNPQSLPEICRDFNFRGCPRANCTYCHACEQCAGPYPKRNCSTLLVGQPTTHPR